MIVGQKIIQIAITGSTRDRFERKHGSMSDFLQMLAEQCRSLRSVGERFGMSTEMARLYYRHYLAPALDAKNGRERRRACKLARVYVSNFPDEVLGVWRMARRHGIAVAAVNSVSANRNENVVTLRHALWLHDAICSIHAASAERSGGAYNGRAHFRIKNVGIRQDKFSFHVCVVKMSKKHWTDWAYYILPADIFSGVKEKSVYLPFIEEENRGIKRPAPWAIKYDWTQYRDAWHLISQSTQSVADP